MRTDAPEYFATTKAKLLLLVGAFLSPIMFLVHELVNYIFVPWACNAAGKLPIYLMSAFSLVVCGIGVWVSWRLWRDAGREMTWELGGSIGRSRFIAFTSVLFSSLFFLATLATSVPNWIMDACHP